MYRGNYAITKSLRFIRFSLLFPTLVAMAEKQGCSILAVALPFFWAAEIKQIKHGFEYGMSDGRIKELLKLGM